MPERTCFEVTSVGIATRIIDKHGERYALRAQYTFAVTSTGEATRSITYRKDSNS